MKNNNGGFVGKFAEFIVDKRKAVYLVYILIAVFCVITWGWTNINNQLTDYLDEQTETKRGLKLMEEEFITYASAEIMIDNITYSDAENLCERAKEIEGVKDIAFDNSEKHYTKGSALFSITFNWESSDSRCEEALGNVKNLLSDYDLYVSAKLGDTDSKTLADEMGMIVAISVIVILGVLLITSKTYMEIPVLVINFGMAALISKGTNFVFGTISFVSNSVAMILQLALAIDYAIILCHRYTEEREVKNAREAAISALSKAIPEIAGSCLTTLSGLAAMAFMHFKIGLDMSMVLIKAIIISILVVFTLMPGLLVSFSKLIDRTHHKSFVPNISKWCKGVIKLRYITPVIFFALLILSFFLSRYCPYTYSVESQETLKKSDAQIAKTMIKNTFEESNVVAVLVPKGDYAKEQAFANEIKSYSQVHSVMGLASVSATDNYDVGDRLSPRDFSELADIDVEKVRLVYAAYAADKGNMEAIVAGIDNYRIALIDMFDFIYEKKQSGSFELDDEISDKIDELNDKLSDGKSQLEGSAHSRIIVDIDLPEESEETFEFLNIIRDTAKKYYGEDVILAGNSTNDYDISTTFGEDNSLISILSLVFVLIVLLFTFKSAGLPIIMLLVIQGSIWINFSFPTVFDMPIYFLAYLVVSSIQMGANIDYAIVMTSRYTELRRLMDKKQAIMESMRLAFPTIFTSGTILALAGFIVGLLTSNPPISSLGMNLGRGTIISIVLVMGILPQLLYIGDFLIDKTAVSVKLPKRRMQSEGTVSLDGRIRGYVNGKVNGTFKGTIDGDFDASVSGEAKEVEHENS